MFRAFIIIALLALLVVLLKRFLSGKHPGVEDKNPIPRAAKMVQCDYCQLYIPETSALKHASHHYCCAEHKQSAVGNDKT